MILSLSVALRGRGWGCGGWRILLGEHAEIEILAWSDHDLATETRQDLRQGFDVESLPGRPGLLERLVQNLGESVSFASGLLRKSVVSRAGPIGNFLDSASRIGLRPPDLRDFDVGSDLGSQPRRRSSRRVSTRCPDR